MYFWDQSKHHFPKQYQFHLSESAALYLVNTLRSFVTALFSVFLPIYVFTATNSFTVFHHDPTINGIIWVLVYYLMRSLAVTALIFLFEHVMFMVLGFKTSILISNMLLIAEIGLWFLAKDNPALFAIAGLIAGVKVIFYWIPYHIFFERKSVSKQGRFGKDVGLRVVLNKVANAAGPIIAGWIIAAYGFNLLFVFGIIVLTLSMIPLFVSVTEKTHHEHDTQKIYQNYYLNPKYKRESIAFGASGVESILFTIFWPILLFVALDSFIKIGALTSISMMFSIVAAYLVGKMIDQHGTKIIHRIGVVFNTLFYLPRIFFLEPLLFYGLDVVDKINGTFYSIPFMAKTYEKARRAKDADFLIYRELAIHLPIVIVCAGAILLLEILPEWKWLLVLAMIASTLTIFMTHHD